MVFSVTLMLTGRLSAVQPAFQPEASFEIFRQIILKEQLHSVP